MLCDREEGVVAELQGLEGSFVFSELLLQRLWHRNRLNWTGAVLLDGRSVELLRPGRWNREAGPDFLGAELRLGGREVLGDVELHLAESDWALHGHSRDPGYAGVVLHAVLFLPRTVNYTVGYGGCALPILPLLPMLLGNLEDIAWDEAAELLAGDMLGGELPAALADMRSAERLQVLESHAAARLEARCRRTRNLVLELGRREALHVMSLGVFGLQRNREPLMALARRHCFETWASGRVDPEKCFSGESIRWSRWGRPANHPVVRMRQYRDWAMRSPGWLEGVEALGSWLSGQGPGGSWVTGGRVSAGTREGLLKHLGVNWGGGGRFDTWVSEALIPWLLVCGFGEPEALRLLWGAWKGGDFDESARKLAKELLADMPWLQPESVGALQGVLGWRRSLPANAGSFLPRGA